MENLTPPLRRRNPTEDVTSDHKTECSVQSTIPEEMVAPTSLESSEKESPCLKSSHHTVENQLLLANDNVPSKSHKKHQPQLYLFEELPKYLQDNEYIRTGYRCYYSYREAWLSVFSVHNETGNIHTHLWGFVAFIALLIGSVFNLPQGSDIWDHIIIALFLISACKCFLFSTLFHTHFCHSKEAFIKFGCLDYAGISILICGSASIITYYAFYCDFYYRAFWLGLLGSISSVGIFGPMFSIWATARFRVWRTLIYVLSGVLSAIPIFHFLIRNGIPNVAGLAFYGWFIMIAAYLGGAFIYAMKIPERWAPGKFDYLFHSHQIWHVCVVAAAYVHYASSVGLLRWRLDQHCPA